MTASLTDVLAAVSVGQGLTSAGKGFGNSQSWRLALEKAHVQNEWVMQATDERPPDQQALASEMAPKSSPLPLPAAMMSDAGRAQATQEPLDNRAAATAGIKHVNTVSGGSVKSEFARGLIADLQASVRGVLTLNRAASSARPAAPLPTPNTNFETIAPRSVHLFSSNGLVHVVVRDEALKGPVLEKLVARIRQVVSGFGETVSKIVVNGVEVWSDPRTPDSQPGDDQKTIEILF